MGKNVIYRVNKEFIYYDSLGHKRSSSSNHLFTNYEKAVRFGRACLKQGYHVVFEKVEILTDWSL